MALDVLHAMLDPQLLLFIFVGVGAGIFIGCLPGLTSTMGVALVLPLTFGMDADVGIMLLLGVYFGAVYGGSISAILLRTPGTPAAAATVLDGYEFSKRGEAGRALGLSTISSFTGGIVSCLVLMLISPQLAKLALHFSSPEFFMLAVFGLTVIASVSGKSLAKGLICGAFGFFLSCIGIDSMTGFLRFTFGQIHLYSGVSYIPVMIGLFAMSQAFQGIEEIKTKTKVDSNVKHVIPPKSDWKLIGKLAPIFGLVGTFIGIIPGAGTDIAAFVSYGQVKNMPKHPEKFGTGIPEGIIAPEAGNNGVTGGALIPMLTLGVPGDSVAAIMIGALTIQGLQPGPMLFKENAVLVYTIFAGAFIANCCMALLGLSCIRVFIKVLSVPKQILVPVIMVLCVVGSYAMSNSVFDIWIMLIFGILGYFLQKLEASASPIILGLILGPMAETHFKRALLMAGGSYSTFVSSGICIGFAVLICISLSIPIIQRRSREKSEKWKAG